MSQLIKNAAIVSAQENQVASPTRRAQDESVRHILVWEIAGELFGCQTEQSREVDNEVRVVPVPHSPDHIAGIKTVRGEVMIVLRLPVLLGRADADRAALSGSIVRLRSSTGYIGILADRVVDIAAVPASEIEPTPGHYSEAERVHLSGLAKTHLGLVNLVNVAALV